MPVFTFPNLSPRIDAAQLAAALGITAVDGTTHQLTDAYATYTGPPAHLVLMALARRDLRLRLLDGANGDLFYRVGQAAVILHKWFTSPCLVPEYAADFAALPTLRACELVAVLADAPRLYMLESDVGSPAILNGYAHDLLYPPTPFLSGEVDRSYRLPEGTPDNPGHPLQVTATPHDGASDVQVMVDVNAKEAIFWQFVVPIPIAAAELATVLMDPESRLGEYLENNRDLIHQYLGYAESQPLEDLSVEASLAGPGVVATYGRTSQQLVLRSLFFVGPDRDTALATTPFTCRPDAEHAAGTGDQVFSVDVEFRADNLRPVT